MKNIVFLICLLVGPNFSNAQKVLKTTFHLEDDSEVSAKKSVYTRIIKSTDNSEVYEFIETWNDGALKRTGFLSEYKPKFKQIGKEIIYHKNGQISTIQHFKYIHRKENIGSFQTTFSESMNVGNIEMFYENGKLKEAGEFKEPARKNTLGRFNYPNYVIKQIADSLGNVFLDSSGTGKVNIKYYDGSTLEGEYIDGLKHGERKEFYPKTSETYIEKFNNGKLLEGIYIDKDGTKNKYTTLEVYPEFPDGIVDFYKFIGKNMEYPSNMKRQQISGTVYVKFFIEKNGSLDDVKVLRGIPGGQELEDEALRVIKMSPKWNPGIQRGKPVRVSFSVPVKFALSK